MLAERREKFKKIEKKIGKIFSQLGFSPNQYTLNSLIFAFWGFLFLINQKFFWALVFFLFAFFFDFVDGTVARFSQMVTKKGAYLDTICDRYIEGLIFLGFLFLPLPKKIFFLPSEIWLFLAFFGSLLTTYAKAAAKEKELVGEELKKGFFGRGERIITLSLALFLAIFNLNWAIYLFFLLAIFSNFTAIQRIFLALKGAS